MLCQNILGKWKNTDFIYKKKTTHNSVSVYKLRDLEQ